jgi:hypothetical protein
MKPMLMTFSPPLNEEIQSTIKEALPRDTGIPILIGALLAVSLGIFIWAAFFRKRARRPRYQFHQDNPEGSGRRFLETWKSFRFFRKRRHHRHRDRRRNPTLAEAGGLPPVRDEDQRPTST